MLRKSVKAFTEAMIDLIHHGVDERRANLAGHKHKQTSSPLHVQVHCGARCHSLIVSATGRSLCAWPLHVRVAIIYRYKGGCARSEQSGSFCSVWVTRRARPGPDKDTRISKHLRAHEDHIYFGPDEPAAGSTIHTSSTSNELRVLRWHRYPSPPDGGLNFDSMPMDSGSHFIVEYLKLAA